MITDLNPDNSAGDAIDPNDAFFDEKGNVISIIDRETDTIFTSDLDGTVDKDKDKDPRFINDGQDPDGQAPDDDAVDTYSNPAEFLLKGLGFEGDEVDIEGTNKKFADLSNDEQIGLISSSVNDLVEHYENQIKELQANGGGDSFKNDAEKQAVEFLREGGSLQDLAKEITNQDPNAAYANMSSEDLVRGKLKDENPTWSDDEIEEEITDLKDRNKLERNAKSIRASLKPDLDLSALKAPDGSQENTFNEQEYQAEVANVVRTAMGIKEIGGVPMNDEIRNSVIHHIVSLNENQTTPFLEELNSPDALFEAAFWKMYGKDIIKQIHDTAYNKGKKDVASQFDDEPSINSRSNNNYDKNLDFNQLLKIDTIG